MEVSKPVPLGKRFCLMICTHWLGELAKLNAARTAARGIAPRKPLMVLTSTEEVMLCARLGKESGYPDAV